MIPDNAPNEACKTRATRLYYFTIVLIVFGLVKYMLMPESAFNDFIMACVLMCAVHSLSYVLLAIYMFLYLTRLADHVVYFLTIVQNGKSFISGQSSIDYARIIILLTSVLHTLGRQRLMDRCIILFRLL